MTSTAGFSGVADHVQTRDAVLLRKTPAFSAAGDGRLVVEVHLHREIARFTLVGGVDTRTALLVIPEPGGIRHLHPFVECQSSRRWLERLRKSRTDRLGVGLYSRRTKRNGP